MAADTLVASQHHIISLCTYLTPAEGTLLFVNQTTIAAVSPNLDSDVVVFALSVVWSRSYAIRAVKLVCLILIASGAIPHTALVVCPGIFQSDVVVECNQLKSIAHAAAVPAHGAG